MSQSKSNASSRGRGFWNSRRGWGRGRGSGRGYNNNWRGRKSNPPVHPDHPSDLNQGRWSQSSTSNSSNGRIQTCLKVASPYAGWDLYFPETTHSEHSTTLKQVQLFEKYFVSWNKLFDLEQIEMKGSFSVDFKELSADQIIIDGFPEIKQELKNTPQSVLSSMGLAMHQIVTCRKDQASKSDDAATPEGDLGRPGYVVPFIQTRIMNFGSPLALKNFKANFYGKFVSVKGTVVRVSNIKPLCTKMAFQCGSCSLIQAVSFPDGKYKLPTKCPEKNCRARTFNPRRNHALTETIDWQTIRVQEIMLNDQKDSGRIPRTIDCELTRDLVDSCVPGDIITVTGVVKVHSVDEGRQRNKDKCMFLLYLHGNHVDNAKGSTNKREDGGQGSGLAMDFSMKELYAIQEIHAQENLFPLLVASLCPSIFGHEMVKAGLLLGLFGGSQKYVNDKNHIPVRGDPHILVVGDPGLGKSQMLQAASAMAPRSVYVCGNTTTTSGLTVTLSKDGGSGDFALEAGALVLADQGCCCIDEFDKMGSQHQALLEAMEQQSISIAKAGIVCSLPARTSILAAANPVGGHYNKGKTVSENLKLGGALLSRFDLVFIMLDKPDEEMDCVLSEHVMALHAGTKSLQTSILDARRNISINGRDLNPAEEQTLSERLKYARSNVVDPIPSQLFRKYVGYARKYVHPRIGKDAAQIIQEFYLSLRRQHQNRDSTPITTRQLESLIRLTEARARLELREVATTSDAQDVIELMKYSMQDVFSDQFGLLDFQRSQHGSGMSGRSLPKKFISCLQRVAETTYNNIFTVQQMWQIAKDAGLHIPDLEGFISSLNNQGFLLKKGNKVYQLQTFG